MKITDLFIWNEQKLLTKTGLPVCSFEMNDGGFDKLIDELSDAADERLAALCQNAVFIDRTDIFGNPRAIADYLSLRLSCAEFCMRDSQIKNEYNQLLGALRLDW